MEFIITEQNQLEDEFAQLMHSTEIINRDQPSTSTGRRRGPSPSVFSPSFADYYDDDSDSSTLEFSYEGFAREREIGYEAMQRERQTARRRILVETTTEPQQHENQQQVQQQVQPQQDTEQQELNQLQQDLQQFQRDFETTIQRRRDHHEEGDNEANILMEQSRLRAVYEQQRQRQQQEQQQPVQQQPAQQQPVQQQQPVPREIVCTICFDNALTERPVVVRSGHCFHFDCLADWVEYDSTCPNCRYPTSLNRCALLL